MKKLILLPFITLFFLVNSYAQTYNFINEVVKFSKQDTIHLMKNFMTDFRVEITFFDESNFREWWQFIPHSNIPAIEPFLDNFNLAHLRANLLTNKNDTLIDFNFLNKRFFKVTENDLIKIKKDIGDKTIPKYDYTKYLNTGYLIISKPVFNCSKNWAIIITDSFNPYFDVATSGYLNIYRKVKGKWILYHKVELWIS